MLAFLCLAFERDVQWIISFRFQAHAMLSGTVLPKILGFAWERSFGPLISLSFHRKAWKQSGYAQCTSSRKCLRLESSIHLGRGTRMLFGNGMFFCGQKGQVRSCDAFCGGKSKSSKLFIAAENPSDFANDSKNRWRLAIIYVGLSG